MTRKTLDPNLPILCAHKDGRHWFQLSFVESIPAVLSTQMPHAQGQTFNDLRKLVGVPAVIDKTGEVWPKPADGWSLWQASPMDKP